MDFTLYWFMFPVAMCVATLAMLSGIGGAALFTPIFVLIFPLLGPEYPLESTVVAIGTALLTETFGFTSGFIGYYRKRLIDFAIVFKYLRIAAPGLFLTQLDLAAERCDLDAGVAAADRELERLAGSVLAVALGAFAEVVLDLAAERLDAELGRRIARNENRHVPADRLDPIARRPRRLGRGRGGSRRRHEGRRGRGVRHPPG